MSNEQSEIVSRAFVDVLEKLAFMFAEPAEKPALALGEGAFLQARMAFSGHYNGTLALVVPATLCPEIAANILGIELDDEKAAARSTDALKELLNVVCGSVLTALVGDRPVFNLSVPEAQLLAATGCQAFLDDSDTLAFLVDEAPVLLRLVVEKE